ncbi:MAG: VOC family protein [Gammaproteobacteria bacterium]|nr:VOC family protein [Gammaproteobacteria bacterium]
MKKIFIISTILLGLSGIVFADHNQKIASHLNKAGTTKMVGAKISNVRFLVTKFDETFLFYRDTLGFKVTWGDLGEIFAQFQPGDDPKEFFTIFSKKLMAEDVKTLHLPSFASAQDNVVLVFSLGSRENVDKFYQILKTKGVKFVDQPQDHPRWGIRTVHLRDPDGNLLEFMAELPPDKYSEELKKEFAKYAH